MHRLKQASVECLDVSLVCAFDYFKRSYVKIEVHGCVQDSLEDSVVHILAKDCDLFSQAEFDTDFNCKGNDEY